MTDVRLAHQSSSLLTSTERVAISAALDHFLSQRIEEGRAQLATVRPELYDALYTAGLRLGVESSTLAQASRRLPQHRR